MIFGHDINQFVIKYMEKEKMSSQKTSGQEFKFLCGHKYRTNYG